MTATLAAVFIASLLGSLHCAGMCGPLVAIAVTPVQIGRPGMSIPSSSQLLLQSAYHGGRLVAYVVLGAIAGAAGAALQQSGSLIGLQRTSGIVSGTLLIVLALLALLRTAGVRIPGVETILSTGPLARLHAAAARSSALPRSLMIGVLSAFLPCGWLYMFVLVAAGTGHIAGGALCMAAFWAGSVPALTGIGAGAHVFRRVLARRIPLLLPLVLVVMGIWTAAGRITLPAMAATPATPASLATDPNAVESLAPSQAPCCKKPWALNRTSVSSRRVQSPSPLSLLPAPTAACPSPPA